MMRAKQWGVPALAMLLGSCGQQATNEWMTGNWVIAPDGCDSHGAMRFDKTGAFAGDGLEGFWKLDGKKLTITSTGIGEVGAEKDVSVYDITDIKEYSFAAKGPGSASESSWSKCFPMPDTPEASSSPEREVVPPVEEPNPAVVEKTGQRKIIWEFTGGFRHQGGGSQYNVPGLCKQQSENLEEYVNSGWTIVSSSSAPRIVFHGECQGRDIIIEQ